MKSTHYIIHDNSAIWGVGKTPKKAWEDFYRNMENANIPVINSDDFLGIDYNGSSPAIFEDFECVPASEALAALVEQCGGNIAWGCIGGTACTMDEENSVYGIDS